MGCYFDLELVELSLYFEELLVANVELLNELFQLFEMELALQLADNELLLTWKDDALQLLYLYLEDIPALVKLVKLLQELGADVKELSQTLRIVRDFLEEQLDWEVDLKLLLFHLVEIEVNIRNALIEIFYKFLDQLLFHKYTIVSDTRNIDHRHLNGTGLDLLYLPQQVLVLLLMDVNPLPIEIRIY